MKVISSVHIDECDATSIVEDVIHNKLTPYFKGKVHPPEVRYGNNIESDDKTITIMHEEKPVVFFILNRNGYNYTVLTQVFLMDKLLDHL